MPSLDRLLRHNPLLMWLARRGILEGSTFPGAKFALGRLQERKVTKSEEKPNEEGPRQDLLDSFLRAKDEKSDVFTDREVLGSSLSMLIAGAETTSAHIPRPKTFELCRRTDVLCVALVLLP